MSCKESELILLLEALERRVEARMRKLGIPREKIRETIMEIERVKQNIIEYGVAEIEKQMGI